MQSGDIDMLQEGSMPVEFYVLIKYFEHKNRVYPVFTNRNIAAGFIMSQKT